MENKKCEYLGNYKESIWDDGERDVEKCELFTDIGIWDEYCEDYCYCSDHKNCKLYKYIKELEKIKKDEEQE